MQRLAIVLATGIFGLLGCRGHTVSTDEFLTKANATCSVAAKRIRGLAAPRTSPSAAPARFTGYVDDYVAEMRLELTNLRSIGYPPGQRTRLEADYRRLDALLADASRHPLAFRPVMLRPAEGALRQAGLPACQE
jgi:hypothetical protein